MIITFKEFDNHFRKHYQLKKESYTIESEYDMQEILYELYNIENFEIDYNNRIIELFN